ncbi:MAG: porin family protein [Vicinamibacterales bacterium]
MKQLSKLVWSTAAALALVVAMGTTSPAAAQGITGFGAKGGVNFATLSIDPADPTCCATKTGLAVGGFVEIGVNDMIAIQPEVLYSMKGAKSSSGTEYTFKVNTVEIPVLVKANIMTSGQMKPFVVVGPAFSFRVGDAKVEQGGTDFVVTTAESNDFSVIFGGGVKVNNITIEARYDLGLKDVDTTTDTIKNRAFTILVGFGMSR